MLHFPTDISYPTCHEPPNGNVLLLTCMDLRLLDNVVAFMDHENLTNRYDHVVFAGASLGALGAPKARRPLSLPREEIPADVRRFLPPEEGYGAWRTAFLDHLYSAVMLHDIKAVYILEHRNCGAYHEVFKVAPDFHVSPAPSPSLLSDEAKVHRRYADLLQKEVHRAVTIWNQYDPSFRDRGVNKIRVYKFLMGVRGEVSALGDLDMSDDPPHGLGHADQHDRVTPATVSPPGKLPTITPPSNSTTAPNPKPAAPPKPNGVVKVQTVAKK